jgi:signal transduction histidine kinase
MAAMGEVLESIAHQWRQPLSNISTISTGISLKKELGTLDDKEMIESMNQINDSVQYLSKTIDDFRSFFKPSKEKTYFTIEETFDKSLLVIGSKFRNENIEFIKEIENLKILNDNNALIQVFINLFNNSKDAFIENKLSNRLIFLKTYKKDNNVIIEVTDNAGGICEKIIDKVFEPYFTTKEKSLGTGIGLYMSEEIVVKHMNGEIKTENIEFEYNNEKQKGVKFSIILPLEN